ncbi:leucyl aminopeptidase [Acetobacteraceae bacterium KSS8]|uniref:Probable cytosol aminopeptidase n=1 Tax=Endosaccharibacter trunci TaxID=2812733 RepID=A0ABT1W2J1_9PROT|nr:leucyl aminopeptidase [Acetobacteraceae bacterium KSS8]
MLDIDFTRFSLPGAGALLLPAFEDADRPASLREADERTGGAVSRAIEAAEFAFGRNKSLVLQGPGAGLKRIVLLGLGKRSEFDARKAEAAGSQLWSLLKGEAEAAVAADGLPAELVGRLALGAVLNAYRFDAYRTTQKPDELPKLVFLSVLCADEARTQADWPALQAVARGVFLTRDLVTEPANILNPPVFAERIAALSSLGLDVEIVTADQMHEMGFGALLGVAMGSDQPARMVVMQWHGAPADSDEAATAPVAFIGKGVTFDSGGISIKPAGGMEDMKWDMAGAGTVVGLMAALAGRKARVNAVGIVGLVENMLSGRAQRPGDVVKSASGQTIEVLNTDAEGRLVLADVLWYAQDRFRPRFMVDLATLTGAIIVALGHEHAGLFGNDDTLCAQLAAAGEATGEKLWRMPLGDAYDKLLRSDIADMKNIGGRPGGSITAAQFLKRFVGEVPWAHLDIAGTAWSSKDAPGVPKGATAFGVRLLDRLVAEHYES